jgi:hypothetical protein
VQKTVTANGVTTTTYYLVDDLIPTDLLQVMDEITNCVVTRTYTCGLQRISEGQIVNNAPATTAWPACGSLPIRPTQTSLRKQPPQNENL